MDWLQLLYFISIYLFRKKCPKRLKEYIIRIDLAENASFMKHSYAQAGDL